MVLSKKIIAGALLTLASASLFIYGWVRYNEEQIKGTYLMPSGERVRVSIDRSMETLISYWGYGGVFLIASGVLLFLGVRSGKAVPPPAKVDR